MSKKNLLIVLGIIVCLMSAATQVIFSETSMQRKTRMQNPIPSSVPRPMVYWLLFQHIKTLNLMADKLESEQKDGQPYRDHYKLNAKLSDEQMAKLNRIVEDCHRQVSQQDAKAKKLIDETRARVPGGKLEAGRLPPPPPVELKRMQKERDAMILAAYNRLREAFGEKEFKRFDKFVRDNAYPGVRALKKGEHVRPEGIQHPQSLPSNR
jgi:hypothetical protein